MLNDLTPLMVYHLERSLKMQSAEMSRMRYLARLNATSWNKTILLWAGSRLIAAGKRMQALAGKQKHFAPANR